jgi:6-phosphogluconate dehydrogenase
MLPAGAPTEQSVLTLAERLEPGDTLIDGGNSYYKDDVRRAGILRPRGIRYIDAGTSGGVWGSERGYCLMLGGDRQAVTDLEPIFKTLAPGLGSRALPAWPRLGEPPNKATSIADPPAPDISSR